mgnify:FL=1
MLLQLEIENIAIIDRLNIALEPGFNALTGETGAGKSILIDSINALLGSRVSRELIRSGAEKATVQGLFSKPPALDPILEEFGIETGDDDTLLISRTITESGKNICRINGTLVTVAMLREIGQRLIDVHGQHDNQSLLRVETHIQLLDLFAGESLSAVKSAYRKELEDLKACQARLRELAGEGKERERLMDTLRYQIEEIRQAALYAGEDEELEKQSRILAHAEDIVSAFNTAYQAIRGQDDDDAGALDRVQWALDALRRVEEIDASYASVCATLEDISERLSDLSRDIRHTRDSTEYDPNLHRAVEERISLIQGLKRKYGETIPDILAYAENAAKRLDELEHNEELIASIKARIKALEASLTEKCREMNSLRLQAGKRLAEGIMKELADLEMPMTIFQVAVNSVPEMGFTADGTDQVEFLFSPNPGEPPKSLSKIASGGEMSRVMLAVKAMLADLDSIPTLIFDEIDTGVSGKAAASVGEKLRALSGKHQVLCVTHHAQIASLAHHHFLITKSIQGDRTVTMVRRLEGQDREAEITRLLSGEHATEAAKSLARELLGKSKGDKE